VILSRAASLDYTTYQVLLSWLHGALQDTAIENRTLLSEMVSPLEQARRALSLSSGQYQVEIWRHFLPSSPQRPLRTAYQQLHARAALCEYRTVPHGEIPEYPSSE
jgi:hypothetical protein